MSNNPNPIIEKLRQEGKTIPEWAREHGFPVRAVRAVIYGHNKGYYGQAHRIAVALRLKDKKP